MLLSERVTVFRVRSIVRIVFLFSVGRTLEEQEAIF